MLAFHNMILFLLMNVIHLLTFGLRVCVYFSRSIAYAYTCLLVDTFYSLIILYLAFMFLKIMKGV